MQQWFSHNRGPITQAIFIFTALLCLLFGAALYFDFSRIDSQALLLFTAILCAALIAKNTFDIAKADAEMRRLEQQLQRGEGDTSPELYRKLYENSPVAYLIIDQWGRVRSANLASLRLFAINQAAVASMNVFERLECDTIDHLDMVLEKYRSGISIGDDTVRVKRDDGREVWVLLSLFTYKNQKGERVGLMTLVDITRQKKAEEAKAEFVSLASHQLRTPLAGMKWSAELLQIDGLDNLSEQQQKYISKLLISIKRMAVLIDDFLRVSRFELGTFKAEERPVVLPDLFRDVLAEQSKLVEQKRLQVKTFFDSSIATVISDPNLLRMVVSNLYSNAVKYTPEGGTIHLGFGEKSGMLVVTVADNGMGIPASDRDKIFSKLFRASNAVRDVPDGTGLGLYILREAVAVLRGRVTFTTAENVGTTFEVRLPLHVPEDTV
jgi:PAS domain S-box-containing protein